MNHSASSFPLTDPTPIFEFNRSSYGSELLTAAIAHFGVFHKLANGPIPAAELRSALGLADRPFCVLLTALRAMQLIGAGEQGNLVLSSISHEHLTGGAFDVSDYLSLTAKSTGVRELVERLVTNRPAGANPEEESTPWIFKEGSKSAMDQSELARHFTLALAGRAKNVAPYLAERVCLSDARLLVDVGGGTGIYAIACLLKNPTLKAIVWDRPEVLRIAAEFAAEFKVSDRLELRPGDMFADPVPEDADVILVSNILHDWDVPECQRLIERLAKALPSGGRLLIHDAFLNDALDGPLPIALYSAALFCVTEGRAYSGEEYRTWLSQAGLVPGEIVPTLVHCGVLPAVKP